MYEMTNPEQQNNQTPYNTAPDSADVHEDYPTGHPDQYIDPGLLPDQIAEDVITAAQSPEAIQETADYPEADYPALQRALDITATYGTLTDAFEQLQGTPHGQSLDHLALLPYSDNVAVRIFPAEHHQEQHLTPERAELFIETVREHHAFLAGTPEEPGIIIPNTYYQVETTPDGETYIHNITERVYGERIVSDRFNHAPIPESKEAVAVHLAKIQLRYHRWILETQQKYFIPDMGNADQCLITSDNQPALVDTDPLFEPFMTRSGMGEFANSNR
jgi:hypothetical protein